MPCWCQPANPRRSSWLAALLAGWACLGGGCAEIAVRPINAPALCDAGESSLGPSATLAPRTVQVLRQYNLEEVYETNPRQAFAQLLALAEREPDRGVRYALAELAHRIARQTNPAQPLEACGYYYLCAGCADHFLFDAPADTADGDNPFDPRFRRACDLYNDALTHCLRTVQQAGRLDARDELIVPTSDGQGFRLNVERHGFAWSADEFGPLLFCADYEVSGLTNLHRAYGLGVPLIGTRAAPRAAAAHAGYFDAVGFPVTAFFRFAGPLADLRTQRAGVLELHDPLDRPTIPVAGRPVPLQTDLTTPLAYFLAKTDLETDEWRGFLHPDAEKKRSGVFLVEPYQPGKIPVVMVHGLLSSPLTWAEMFNDLRADPDIRRRFQFWFYLYPTGDTYLQAAADLRRDLTQLRDALDPAGRDPALDQLVLVGHSMGGLVSRLLTVDSGESFRELVSTEPFSALNLKPETRARLEPLFYFERQSYIRRVVFIGTPHRGSGLSPSPLGRLATRLVHVPRTLRDSTQELMTAGFDVSVFWKNGRLPTSVDLLAPDAPALQVLAAQPRPADVHYHSIVGQAQPRTLLRELTRPILGNEQTDGVVPYRSAHLDCAESELVVPANHLTVHHQPLAVREVRRILREHEAAVFGAAAAADDPSRPEQRTVEAPSAEADHGGLRK
jgi:pimeloyl-ACP methyl ester carboxylesterase